MQKNLYRYLFVIFILLQFSPAQLRAQISKADSNFLSSICTEPTYISYWNYPGNWFHSPEISSVQNFYDMVDSSYHFYNDEFADCYRKITVADEMERDTLINYTIDTFEIAHNLMIFGNKNPFVKLKFNLNNKSAYSYALLDSTSKPVYNNDYAFVIISGTGTNQIKPIIDGNGYHDLNCYTRNLLKPYGDIYIMSMPNEDHRAIYFNKKKATSFAGINPPYLINYLNSANKSIGLNRLIETVAFIKHLKSKYKKVFVLGLSTGGKVALWASMLAEPDGALVSSGYSILVDNDYQSQLINALSYGNYLVVYDKDSTRSRLGQMHTQFLFTQAQNNGALIQKDIDSSYTKNFFEEKLDNASFFYNYVNHAFPPCPAIDSFLGRCFSKAKVFLTSNTAVCNYDSIVMDMHFFGKAPFSFQLYKDSTFISNYYSSDTTFSISLFSEGNYLIKNIIDSASVPGYTSDTFKYRKPALPSAVLTKKEFVCDSNMTKVLFDFAGQSPFMVYYTRNNVADSILFNHSHDSALFAGGHYLFSRLNDAGPCSGPITDSMDLFLNNLSFSVNNVQYNCLSDQSAVSLTSNGVFPVTLTFYDSTMNSLRIHSLNSPQQILDLDSGSYTFLTVSDSSSCIKMVDTGIWIHTERVSLQYDSLKYNCADDFAILPIHLKGKNSWTIQMEHNGVTADVLKNLKLDTLRLQPGISKIIKITDANNCVTKIDDSLIVNAYKKMTSGVITGEFDCTAKSALVELLSTGNYPIHVYGQKNGQVWDEFIYTSPVSYSIPVGVFSIDSLLDHTKCIMQGIFHSTLINDTIDETGLYQDKLQLRTTNTTFSAYYWYLNDVLIKETTEPYLDIKKSGVYEVGFFNNNHCFLKTRKLTVDLGKISIYPNPVKREINILVKLDPEEKLQFRLLDLLGNEVVQNALVDGLNHIDLPDLAKGTYLLVFETNMKNIRYPSQRIFKD